MKIGCIIFYDEKDFIEACIEHLIDKVDRIVAVDGAYKKFPHDQPFSTDGTLEIINELQAKYPGRIEVIENDKAWDNEVDKRNAYLVGQDGDYYIAIDCDEMAEGTFEGIESKDDWQLELFRMDGVHPYLVYRIFKHRPGIRYFGCHNAICLYDRLLNHDVKDIWPKAKIKHYLDSRDESRRLAKGEYYRGLYNDEREFRLEHKL
jgi:glycosyltransferase involved in cell wall biosynthesis